MGIDNSFVPKEVPAPDSLDELAPGEHSSRRFGHCGKEVELEGGEVDGLLVTPHLSSVDVHGDGVELEAVADI